MALQDIINKIKSDAELQSKQIEQSAVEERNRIINEAKQKGEEVYREIISKNEEKIKQERNRQLVFAGIESNKEILREKNRWLDESFKSSFEKIKSLTEGEYREFLKKLIINVVESGSEELVLAEEDYNKFGKKLLDEINKELKNGNLKLSSGKLDKGFILREGKREKNCTFDALFSNLREQIETEVAKKLFE